MLTAVFSSFNETQNVYFWANLELLKSQGNIEIIICDGGSEDGTIERVGKSVKIEALPNSSRAERYNRGLDFASGSIILLVHPRSLLPKDGIEFLMNHHAETEWGAFSHSFDVAHPVFRFTSWYSNVIRGSFRGIFYLDHCLYLSADLAKIIRFRSVYLFEDTYFSLEARRFRHPKLLTHKVQTSAVRFQKNGILRQALLNQTLKVLFLLGCSDEFMQRVYERGLNLNHSQKKGALIGRG